MVYAALEIISSFVLSVIHASGYAGVFFLMVLGAAAIPIPSEVIMPFSGFLISQHEFRFIFVICAGVVGNLAGALLLYAIGRSGGRSAVVRYGRYLMLSGDHLDRAERWFGRVGFFAVFGSMMLPVVRAYISLPAGLAKMNLIKFCSAVVAGSLVWAVFLTWLGFYLGERWQVVQVYIRKFDILIIGIIVIGLAYVVWSHIKHQKLSV